MSQISPSPLPHADTVLIFTGHMVDLPQRETPRFPPEMEPLAAKAVRDHLAATAEGRPDSLLGIASGARGGDILFHEICRELDIPTIIVLPFDVPDFLEASVLGVESGNWKARFERVWEGHKPNRRIVLDTNGDADPFGACNRAMLDMAQRIGDRVELIALWDGADIGKPGGTGAFVSEAQSKGGHFIRIDTKALLADLGGTTG